MRRRGLLLLVAWASLMVGAGDRSGAQNLFVNGSFESPVVTDDVGFGWLEFTYGDDIAGWTVDHPDGAEASKAHGGVDLHARQGQTPWTCADGVQALDLNGHSPGAVYQDVGLAPGQWHALNFFLSANLACSPSVVSMRVLFDDELVAEEHFDTDGKTFENMGWQAHAYLLEGSAPSHRVKLASLSSGPCGPAIDDVVLAPVWDLGDAPDSYGSSLDADGAAHRLGSASDLFLGACVDGELDISPDGGSTGDDKITGLAVAGTCLDGDDEDGVSWAGPWVPCQETDITVLAPAGGQLDAWVDFGRDGSFEQSSDRIFDGFTLLEGANVVPVPVPCDASEGTTFARFRLSSAGTSTASGIAADGEVEDYEIALTPQPPTPGPSLLVPSRIPAAAGSPVKVDVIFDSGGFEVAATAFSVDYDAACLAFDGHVETWTDDDFAVSIEHDVRDTDGELDFIITDLAPPIAALVDGALLSITFTPTCTPAAESTIVAPAGFSSQPEATFSDREAGDLEGWTRDGSVEIWPGLRGDCNANLALSAADLIATALEIFDGDGSLWSEVAGGTFAGSPIGCDANGDLGVDAGDISCTARLLFGQSCGAETISGETTASPSKRPRLELGGPRADADGTRWLTVRLDPGDHAISSLAFSLDLGQGLEISDRDLDRLPDGLRFPAGRPDLVQVRYDAEDSDGELDVVLANAGSVLEAGIVVEVEVVSGAPREPLAGIGPRVRFSRQPAISFGALNGESVAGHGSGREGRQR